VGSYQITETSYILPIPNQINEYFLQRLAVWLVADFEALSCQVTTTFDTGCAARIRTAPAINYTACCAFGFYLFHFLIVN